MGWFWLNIPLGMVIVLAVSGIPLWLVLKHPDERPSISVAAGDTPAQAGQPSDSPAAMSHELVRASRGRAA
jgi:hypothetical protein